MDQKNFFEGKINAVNVGTGIFHTGMREQNVAAVQVNWRPPVDAKLIKLLRKCDETSVRITSIGAALRDSSYFLAD